MYRRRRCERTPLYQSVQGHLETYLGLAREGRIDGDGVAHYVERAFRRYLECGILAHGLACARCAECRHDFLIAFSCKGRAVCPACNARRMICIDGFVDEVMLPDRVQEQSGAGSQFVAVAQRGVVLSDVLGASMEVDEIPIGELLTPTRPRPCSCFPQVLHGPSRQNVALCGHLSSVPVLELQDGLG